MMRIAINLYNIQREASSYSISDMCSDNGKPDLSLGKKLKPQTNWQLGSWLALLLEQSQLDQ